MAATLRATLYLAFAGILLMAAGPAMVFGATEDEPDPNQIYDPALYAKMEYRMIGPYRGGRVTAVAGVRGRLFTYYFGATGGGVWKTTSAGESWTNVTDEDFEVGSIGAIAVGESDPNVVYVGTGSACPRGNV